MLDILTAGILAPSADNRHQLHFRLQEDGFSVHADSSFIECQTPHRRWLTLIAYGAVVENIRLTLTTHGRSFEPRWFPDAGDPSLLVRVRWRDLEAVAIADPLAGHIVGRHTNRRLFHGPTLSRSALELLEKAVTGASSVALTWCDTGERRRALLRLIRLAETARFRNEALHRELFESIDFDVGWRHATNERLAPGSLEVELPMRGVFKALRRWPFMRWANRLGTHRVLGLRAGDLPARTAPHLGVLTSGSMSPEAALALGASFQRLWLVAESMGLALQPMVASAILSIRSDPRNGLPRTVFEPLHAGWKALIGDATPLVVFRLGRATRPTIRSGRRPIASYLA